MTASCIHHDGTGCTIGRYGGNPSPGTCAVCPVRVPPVDESSPVKPRPWSTARRWWRCSSDLICGGWRWLRAEWSMLRRGPVSAETYDDRCASCRSCEHHATLVDGGEGCIKCGCVVSGRAVLTIRNAMPDAECPLPSPRWATAPGVGWRYLWRRGERRRWAPTVRSMISHARAQIRGVLLRCRHAHTQPRRPTRRSAP